jgi:hypothetical protein
VLTFNFWKELGFKWGKDFKNDWKNSKLARYDYTKNGAPLSKGAKLRFWKNYAFGHLI